MNTETDDWSNKATDGFDAQLSARPATAGRGNEDTRQQHSGSPIANHQRPSSYALQRYESAAEAEYPWHRIDPANSLEREQRKHVGHSHRSECPAHFVANDPAVFSDRGGRNTLHQRSPQ